MRNIPNHVGSFKVKKELTKRLNYGDWIIYRDPENGIYLYNVSMNEEINPLLWNITSKGWTEKTRKMLISDIENFMKTYKPYNDFAPNKIEIRL